MIKKELLKGYISDCIGNYVDSIDFDAGKIADTLAICILSEIQNIIINEKLSDFEMVEEIVCIFERYNISAGACHDF